MVRGREVERARGRPLADPEATYRRQGRSSQIPCPQSLDREERSEEHPEASRVTSATSADCWPTTKVFHHSGPEVPEVHTEKPAWRRYPKQHAMPPFQVVTTTPAPDLRSEYEGRSASHAATLRKPHVTAPFRQHRNNPSRERMHACIPGCMATSASFARQAIPGHTAASHVIGGSTPIKTSTAYRDRAGMRRWSGVGESCPLPPASCLHSLTPCCLDRESK